MTDMENTFIAPCDLRLTSTAGHTTTMKANEKKQLPTALHEEARKAGAVSMAQLESMNLAAKGRGSDGAYVPSVNPSDYADPTVPLPDVTVLLGWTKKQLDTLAKVRFDANIDGRANKETTIDKIMELEARG